LVVILIELHVEEEKVAIDECQVVNVEQSLIVFEREKLKYLLPLRGKNMVQRCGRSFTHWIEKTARYRQRGRSMQGV
jgi:hypothetical protein